MENQLLDNNKKQETVLLTSRETAKMLRVSISTLQIWRKNKVGPNYHKLNHCKASTIRYNLSDIQDFIKKSLHQVNPDISS